MLSGRDAGEREFLQTHITGGDWKAKIRMLAWSGSAESLFLGRRLHSFQCLFLWQKDSERSLSGPFYQGANSFHDASTMSQPGLEFQHIIFFTIWANREAVSQLCPTLATPGTETHQVPLSMEFSRPEYWSGLPFPSSGHLPNPGVKPALQANSLPSEPPGKPNKLNRDV